MSDKTKALLKHAAIVLGVGVVAYALFAIYKAFKDGERKLSELLKAPFKMFSDAAGAVKDLAAAPGDLVDAAKQSEALDKQIVAQNANDYAPGGRIYNNILATQGQAAADAAWQAVQRDEQAMVQQTSDWWKFWKP